MDQGATNPYVVLTAYGPHEEQKEPVVTHEEPKEPVVTHEEPKEPVVTHEEPKEPVSVSWGPVQVFQTKIETLTQQVSNLTQVVSQLSQKTEKLYHDYLNMQATLNYQKDYYGLPQPPLSNPQAPASNTFQLMSAEELQDSSQDFLERYNRRREFAIANNWTILSPR